jgi:UDP-N-acetylglucosamine acyltransferase
VKPAKQVPILKVMIHATAIVHPGAQIDTSVTIGPYSVIDQGVVIGANCVIGPHCHLTGLTRLGAGNRLHAGCVLGDAPQDLKYTDAPTGLAIGDRNVFREHVTVSRSNSPEEETVVGSHNYLMANAHVGHNSILGDHVIMTNNAALGGHVVVQDRAFISTNCLVHQFVRVGTLSLMQGGAAISKDLPPFTIARGPNGICGLNVIGLRRAGITSEQRLELKKLYRLFFRSGLRLKEALGEAGPHAPDSPAAKFIEFAATTKRGLCADKGRA